MNYTTSPAFTLTTSHKKDILQMTDQDFASPGPKYNLTSSTAFNKTGGCKIGNSRRTQINYWVEQTPSPTQYNPEKTTKNQTISIPKYKPIVHPNNVPGSSWYKPSSKLVRPQTATYTMGSRYGSIMDNVKTYPGPASYQTNRDTISRTKSARNIGFTTAKRFSQSKNHPGVGDYQIAEKEGMVNNKGSIGRGQREPIERPNYPSPDTYLKVSCFDDKIKRRMGKSMSAKLQGCFDLKNETTEAFLKYTIKTDLQDKKSQQYTIPKTKRKMFQRNSQQPGPADYVTHEYQGKNSVKVPFYMQNYSQYNEAAEFPGPGAYQPSPSPSKKYTIARAKSATRFQDHPGVGRYNVNVQANQKANLFGKSQRTDFVSKNIAGVGDYKLQQSRKYKGTIGKSQRFKKQQKMPGPGDYHIQSIIGYKSKHL